MIGVPEDRRCVVVGVDGSEGCRRGLEWALDKEDRFGLVKPVTTFVVGPFADGFGTNEGVKPGGQPYRDEAVSRMSEVLNAVDPELLERAEAIQHWAGPGLVDASKDAELLVVGSRGRSALAETLLGSVRSYCVKHSRVPVAVIPDDVATAEPLSTVVVGVDGSANADAALRWAIELVEPDGRVIALGVFSVPDGEDPSPTAYVQEAEMQRRVEQAVNEAQDQSDKSRHVEITLRSGDPRIELPKAGEQADLLVVGSRGHRSVAHLLLGSVATALTHHPTMATVVVPES